MEDNDATIKKYAHKTTRLGGEKIDYVSTMRQGVGRRELAMEQQEKEQLRSPESKSSTFHNVSNFLQFNNNSLNDIVDSAHTFLNNDIDKHENDISVE